MAQDTCREGEFSHRNFYRQDINSSQFYVRCGVCNQIVDTITHGVNPIPQDSYTRIISRREMERRRPSSSQRLDAVSV